MRTSPLAAGVANARAVALVFTLLIAVPTWASGPLEGIRACRGIADGSSRLACFDRESAALGNLTEAPDPAICGTRPASSRAGAAPSQPAASAAAALGATLDPRQTFGLPPIKILAQEEAAAQVPRQLDRITAHIDVVSEAADGRDIFSLDNRQVWAQLVPDGDLYVRPGDIVEISRGALGSYWLALKSRRGGCKVIRLR